MLLVRHNLRIKPQLRLQSTWRVARNLLLHVLAIRVVLLPVPLVAPANAAAALADESEPPSIVRLSNQVAEALAFTPDSSTPFTVSSETLQNVAPGKSVATERAEAKKAEEARKKAAEAAARKKAATRVVYASVPDTGTVQRIAYEMTVARFGAQHWDAMYKLIMRESGFNPRALNPRSGACGIPQALPCSKLPQGINTPVEGQIQWMLNYIANRYGTPTDALNFSYARGWY